MCNYFLYRYRDRRDLHSFPTRRSSDLTTGGAPTMTVEERLQPALQLKPEVASLNMGSMNFGLYEMLGRYKDWKRSEEHTSELQSLTNLVCRLLLEKKKQGLTQRQSPRA